MIRDSLACIVEQFEGSIPVTTITPFGRGHINTTYKVQAGKQANYLLQKINQNVFRDVAGLMHNIELVTSHIQKELKKESHPNPERAGLTLISANNNSSYVLDEQGDAWRLLRFIDDSCTHELVSDPQLAREGSRAFGEFQRHIEGIDPKQLNITIPRFHHLPTRLDAFEVAIKNDSCQRVGNVSREIAYVHDMKEAMGETQRLLDAGLIPIRVTHNDTKLNNVLFSNDGSALCVIDLDTVMPGVFQFDFSDTVRTTANTAVEDEQDLDKVRLNPELFSAITDGFLQATRHILTETEVELLAPAAGLMPFIIGLRFLTDYLHGDTYFKTHHPSQNIDRARCQFKLSQNIQAQQSHLQKIVASLVKNP